MEEIELSFMPRTQDTFHLLRGLLDEFEKKARIHVKLREVLWSRSELIHFAIYQQGSDVSEVGVTWVDDLVAMNALRPYTFLDQTMIGKPEDFLSSSWQAGRLPDDEHLWAIPWLVEPYVIHYRKDLLRQAGVDEATAFQTHGQIAQTVESLKQSGIQIPLAAPVLTASPRRDPFCILQALCSWVWGRGKDFCTPDGKRVLLNEPGILAAMHDYFLLFRSISKDSVPDLMEKGSIQLFRQGQAAITFGTMTMLAPWNELPVEMQENWGVVAFPKAGFVGGTHLVVWEYTRHPKEAVELVRFLTSPPSLLYLAKPLCTLPPRLSVLSAPDFRGDPLWDGVIRAAENGRSSPSIKLWGLIEEKLLNILHQIAEDLIRDPYLDADTVIYMRIEPFAKKLSLTLSQ